MLAISEKDIRSCQGARGILRSCWRQWWTERALAHRGIRFRGTSFDQVLAAYSAMKPEEFDAVNARQEWANWRTIPRALSGHVPERPLRVLDLGCGTGGSTRVLAYYCPAGSHFTGYELAGPLLAVARLREYRHRTGSAAQVEFVCQEVGQRLLDSQSDPVADASVDLVNSSGVVGHHLDPQSFLPLRAELVRVLKPDGVAMLDVGPTFPAARLRVLMTDGGFAFLGHFRSWFGDPTGALVFRRGSFTSPR